MSEKYVKIMQDPKESIIDYIKRLDTMQKSATDDTIYYGRYVDNNTANESYFNGKDLPLVEFDTEYKYLDAGPGNVVKIMEHLKSLISERIDNGEDIHLYTVFGNIGFVSSEELFLSDDMEKLFKDKLESQHMLAKEYGREYEEKEAAERKAQEQEKANLKEKYVKVSKKPNENLFDYIKRLSDLQQNAKANTVYYGSYINENGETYLNGKSLPPVDFEKDYIYVQGGPGLIPEQLENARKALSERIASGHDPHTYTIYGNIGLVTSDALLECNSRKEVNELCNKLFNEQRNLKRIDRLLENDR